MAGKNRRMSLTAVMVLRAVSDGLEYGFEIMDSTELPSGTVYPILSRLERSGLIRSRWERPEIYQREKRPPRKYYRITSDGHKALSEGVAYYQKMLGAAVSSEGLSVEPETGRS